MAYKAPQKNKTGFANSSHKSSSTLIRATVLTFFPLVWNAVRNGFSVWNGPVLAICTESKEED
ncbi:MAG: hypothetical protein NTX25_15200, partial [Proteobacteria bacterium]|nr:hypothetical protein [Pseudomonadota bacterium]